MCHWLSSLKPYMFLVLLTRWSHHYLAQLTSDSFSKWTAQIWWTCSLRLGQSLTSIFMLPTSCYEPPYFHIFTSYHILSRLVLSTDCFIICFVTDHTPFHYQSRTHVGYTLNTWMTSYMLIPHGLPIEYTSPALVAHMVVSVLLLTCSYYSYLMVSWTSSIQYWVKGVSLAETCMDKESQTQTY